MSAVPPSNPTIALGGAGFAHRFWTYLAIARIDPGLMGSFLRKGNDRCGVYDISCWAQNRRRPLTVLRILLHPLKAFALRRVRRPAPSGAGFVLAVCFFVMSGMNVFLDRHPL